MSGITLDADNLCSMDSSTVATWKGDSTHCAVVSYPRVPDSGEYFMLSVARGAATAFLYLQRRWSISKVLFHCQDYLLYWMSHVYLHLFQLFLLCWAPLEMRHSFPCWTYIHCLFNHHVQGMCRSHGLILNCWQWVSCQLLNQSPNIAIHPHQIFHHVSYIFSSYFVEMDGPFKLMWIVCCSYSHKELSKLDKHQD